MLQKENAVKLPLYKWFRKPLYKVFPPERSRNWLRKLGIENMSHGQASMMAKGLDRQVSEFRTRSLKEKRYPVLWTDALYEKVRVDGRVISMAVIVICGVNEEGKREILAVEPMMEESSDTYKTLFYLFKKEACKIPCWWFLTDIRGLLRPLKRAFPDVRGSTAKSI